MKGLSGNVKWSSSNKKVATVTSKGKVTAKKEGKATIKAKVGKKTFTCKVTVVQRAASTSKEEDFGSDSPNGTYTKPTTSDQETLAKKVGSYTYKITPVNGKLNNIIFVETNNPDPNSFQLADESSKYLEKGKTALYKPLPFTYADVQYSNASTRRIANKEYLFYC